MSEPGAADLKNIDETAPDSVSQKSIPVEVIEKEVGEFTFLY